VSVPFDVNDAGLREAFVRQGFLGALALLTEGEPARWGRMSAQQMVEHLEWTFAISTGRVQVECPVPEAERARVRAFLRSNMPTPQGFQNPVLTEGLPPLLRASLADAKAALHAEVERFVAQAAGDASAMRVHPLFGSIGVEDWWRTHYKHCHHHLQQFGLLESPREGA
jgi:oxepin-CoA hydrolase / 3-oxo-5,6-dehydrosuberyl-CoA semialdehyde dehydrogenase